MKKTLKNIALCFCAATVTAFCFPQIGNSVASANSIAEIESENPDKTDKTGRTRPRKIASETVNDAANSEKSVAESTENTLEKAPAAENESAEEKSNDESKAAAFTATAYALRGRTANGSSVRRGIIAADPRVLPLGTRVRLSAGNWSGVYTVADTGGGVKGRKIDVWVPNNGEARQFGRRKIMLTVLNRRSN